MSFAFDFASDELDEGGDDDGTAHVGVVAEEQQEASRPSGSTQRGTARRHRLDEMIATLPSKISYSRLDLPTRNSSRPPTTLYRRDLFDARFQMIHEEEGEEHADATTTTTTTTTTNESDRQWNDVMAGAATDLVPGIYEGGLKTWECSLDLAAVLADRLEEQPDLLHDKTVLELGCGTAIPSLFLFARALEQEGRGGGRSVSLQLCDFNEQVLRLVTLPNLILTWHFSTGAAATKDDDKDDVDEEQDSLELSDELLDAFRASLRAKNILLDFYSGHWEGLQHAGAFSIDRRPDIILTSETIYSIDAMPLLVDTLDDAINGGTAALEKGLAQQASLHGDGQQTSSVESATPLCLVAAKVVYFGVGGGMYAFEQELRRRRARAATIWKSDRGVARVVLQVTWRPPLSAASK